MKAKTTKRAVKTVRALSDSAKQGQFEQGGQALSTTKHNAYFGISAVEANKHYQRLHGLGTLLQCQYAIELQNIYHIASNASWFGGDFPLAWLATDVELTNGSSENESFYAGAWQLHHFTQHSLESIEVTFIETAGGDIAKSAGVCQGLAYRADGTMTEPKHYTFKLTIKLLGKQKSAPKDYLVAVKSFSTSLSSSGRSEVAKTQVTFQVIAPYGLFAKSPAKR